MYVSNISKSLSSRLYTFQRKVVAESTSCSHCVTQRRRTSSSTHYSLPFSCINPQLKIMEYAVRGPISVRARELAAELKSGVKKPFTNIIKTNLGDCHAVGQTPITFIRQILALVTYPDLLNDERFPEDTKKKACDILASCKGGSVGSYTESNGIELIRKQVAKYIEKRDGFPSDWSNIVLSGGASDGIRSTVNLIKCISDGKKAGVMVPVPQYPLYSALLTEYEMYKIDYSLDEKNNWALDLCNLQEAIGKAKKKCIPRAIVVINPGNPTGQVLSRQNIEDIIKFAYKEKLLIIADEVYQMNIYAKESKFFSFKKVLMEMGPPYNKMELASFMSCSKCYMGECGLRGGYNEIINLDPEVKAVFVKSLTVKLCPTVLGQATMYAVVNEPQNGEPSYERFTKEKEFILETLKTKAKIVEEQLNAIEGFQCNVVQGAMYAFPQITLPPQAIEVAKSQNKKPDELYVLELLENTGVSVVPGSGFGQAEGTYHFRTTILPPTDEMTLMLEKVKVFHEQFLKKYC